MTILTATGLTWRTANLELDFDLVSGPVKLIDIRPSSGELRRPLRNLHSCRIERVYPSDDLGAAWATELDGGLVRVTRPDTLPAAAMFRIISEGTTNA